ncbi:MAG: 23S rRNA (uracil(1939)-C(5))-methyltransferase RlmD [Thalassotalea sp.]|nr:23S rRNA (uracil(1939)-C(5))-methyltransferase RlmD [Thalassotalea sp.]
MANFFKVTPKTQNLGKQCKLKISRLDFNGCGVGAYQQKTIFIDGTLPGETVVAKVVEQKNKYYRGKLLEVVSPSEHRVKAACQHFSSCGGCDLQHLNHAEHLVFKQQKVTELFERHKDVQSSVKKSKNPANKITLPWQESINSQAWHYRRKARIGVQYNKNGQATIGFRQRASNQLVAIKKCPVLVEPFAELFNPLNELLAKLSGVNPIGHLEVIFTHVNTLIIRQLVKMSAQDRKHWLTFSELYQCQIMVDDGKSIEPLTACETLNYRIDDDITLEFDADDFIQVNHQVNTQMVAQALEWLALEPQDNVLDLFCGLGNFSLPLAKRVENVIGVEGVDKMVIQAKKNAADNHVNNCQFYQADLNSDWQSFSWAKETFNKVLIDPARAGAYKAIEQLVKLNIPQLLYVSCDPSTLAKDSALLVSHGYKIEKIALIDMFSQTKHIETMVLFVR